MSEWTGETDAGRGGGYDYQWVVSALLSVNYLLSEAPADFLHPVAHRSLGTAEQILLEWNGKNANGEKVDLQDIVLENADSCIQVQVKRRSEMWPPYLIRRILEHLRARRKSPNDYLVFMSDRDVHDDFAPLRSETRDATKIAKTLEHLSRREAATKTAGQATQPVPKVITGEDLEKMFVVNSGDQSRIEWSLREILRGFIPVNHQSLETVIEQFRLWSIAPHGTIINVRHIQELIARAASLDFPVAEWLAEETNKCLIENLLQWRRSKRSSCRPDPNYPLQTLRLLLRRPRSVLRSESARFGLMVAQVAACFISSTDWEEVSSGVGLDPDLARKAHGLACSDDLVSGLPAGKSTAEWPGPPLRCLFQLTQRMNWHHLGLFRVLPSDLNRLERQIQWRCFFLQSIQFDHVGTRTVRITLCFPNCLDQPTRQLVRECWFKETHALATEFNALTQDNKITVEFPTETLDEHEPKLSDEQISELKQMLGPLLHPRESGVGSGPSSEKPSQLQVTAASEDFLYAGTSATSLDLMTKPGNPVEWSVRAEDFESKRALAQARMCWEKSSQLYFSTGDYAQGFRSYLRSVQLVQVACWSPFLAREPGDQFAGWLAQDSNHELRTAVYQSSAWSSFGELRFAEAKRQLNLAISLPTNRRTLSAILQLARLHVVEQEPQRALELLQATLQSDGPGLDDRASQIITLAGELKSSQLLQLAESKTPPLVLDTPHYALAKAAFLGRSFKYPDAHSIYVSMRSRELSPSLLALSIDADQFFAFKYGFLLRDDSEQQSQRIDCQRSRESQAWNWLDRGYTSYSRSEWPDCLSSAYLCLDACLVEGDWVCREQAHRFLARVHLQTGEDLVAAMHHAVLGCDIKLIKDSGSHLCKSPHSIERQQLVNRLLCWPRRSYEFPFTLEALAALSDILTDNELDTSWNLAFLASETRQEVWSSAALIKALSASVSESGSSHAVRRLAKELESFSQESRLEAIIEALEAIITEYPSAFADDWHSIVGLLLVQAARKLGPVSNYQRVCRNSLLSILRCAPESIRLAELGRLGILGIDLPTLKAKLNLAEDESVAWARAKSYLENLPDPIEKRGEFLRMIVTGGDDPDEALSLMPSLSVERQRELLLRLCDVLLEHDCLPVRRAAILLRLSQMEDSYLALESENLAAAAILCLQGDFVKGAWSEKVAMKVSHFSHVKTDYGSFTVIDRGATSLLGVLYPHLSAEMKFVALGHLTRAAGSTDQRVRQGVAIGLFTCSSRLRFDNSLLLLLFALVKDDDPTTAGFSVRAAAIQLALHPCEHEELLLGLMSSRHEVTDIRPALARAISTLLAGRPELAGRLSTIYDALASDQSFRVRKRLAQPDCFRICTGQLIPLRNDEIG